MENSPESDHEGKKPPQDFGGVNFCVRMDLDARANRSGALTVIFAASGAPQFWPTESSHVTLPRAARCLPAQSSKPSEEWVMAPKPARFTMSLDAHYVASQRQPLRQRRSEEISQFVSV